MRKRKMVLIGAGSAMFTQGLVMDLIRNPAGAQWELALCDIDEPVLEAMAKLVAKIIRLKDAPIKLSHSADRRDLLPEADYVVTTIGVGGRRAWEKDVFIPRKYGVFQPVGDTAMPGGISRAMRMTPAMLDIARDIRALCPNAFFVNYANPMAILCRALYKAEKHDVTGLCHGVPDTVRLIARMAGLDHSRVTASWAGINHLTFIHDLRVDGLDAWPDVLKNVQNPDREKFCYEFLARYRAFPAPGDRHVTEFFTERFAGGKYYGNILGVDAYSFEGTIEGGDRTHEQAMRAALADGPLPEDFIRKLPGEHEQLMEIIESREYDLKRVYSANRPNRGAVPNLPFDAVVELPCAAAAGGMSPLHVADFPDELAAIVSKNLAIIELAADAALRGDVRLYEEAILAGGYMTDAGAVSRMVTELIGAHKAHLPQFA